MIKLSHLEVLFPNEDACKDFLVKHRWPDGVRCARCNHEKVYTLKARPFHWQCHNCAPKGYRFSVITGTVFENTKYPLKIWFTVAFLMLHSKKGMSALQIKRTVFHDKASYETVWYMCTRIRAAMNNAEFEQLMGIVEVDETYIGGKDRNRHWNKKSAQQRDEAGPRKPGDRIGYGKVGVIGAIARKGNVVAKVIGNAGAETLAGFVDKTVSRNVELVNTDDNPQYNYVRRDLPHEAVNHSQNEGNYRLD